MFCTKALPACGACPLAPMCEYAQQGGRRLVEADPLPSATAGPGSAAPTALATPLRRAAATKAAACPAVAAYCEPAAPDTPPRVETAKRPRSGSPAPLQRSAAQLIGDIENSATPSCALDGTAASLAAATPASAIQAAGDTGLHAAGTPSRANQDQPTPAARIVLAPTQEARAAEVQRILAAGDSRTAEGPAAASGPEQLTWWVLLSAFFD